MSTEQHDPEHPGEAQTAEPPPQDPRRRLRELLAIPERDRSDAVWDEIIELEIDLAPGNRAPGQQGEAERGRDAGRRPQPPAGGKPGRGGFKNSRRRGGR